VGCTRAVIFAEKKLMITPLPQEIERALVNHFLVIYGELSDENAGIHNGWFRLCHLLSIPFIEVRIHNDFAFVQIDCWTSSNLDENARTLIQAAFQNEVDFLPPKKRGNGFLVTGSYCEIRKVLPARAEALAAKLFRYWQEHNRASPNPNLTRVA
jgi:hypothetical protein